MKSYTFAFASLASAAIVSVELSLRSSDFPGSSELAFLHEGAGIGYLFSQAGTGPLIVTYDDVAKTLAYQLTDELSTFVGVEGLYIAASPNNAASVDIINSTLYINEQSQFVAVKGTGDSELTDPYNLTASNFAIVTGRNEGSLDYEWYNVEIAATFVGPIISSSSSSSSSHSTHSSHSSHSSHSTHSTHSGNATTVHTTSTSKEASIATATFHTTICIDGRCTVHPVVPTTVCRDDGSCVTHTVVPGCTTGCETARPTYLSGASAKTLSFGLVVSGLIAALLA
ncbi:hypothetical protein CANCADRAFT_2636 [Tortispora caseinolytica NRRL Y-17796]|uniref:Uncharacterized protein n=1 Tax=Tortispora caseinolytica NRRL Y-17796 TaxID=767744 RepID=A0A1E4TGW2_9ASCO|nr:hypothetical protein CANCADRAFT_2636 [Tortispora caseinolytica NRRL Y-17796]